MNSTLTIAPSGAFYPDSLSNEIAFQDNVVRSVFNPGILVDQPQEMLIPIAFEEWYEKSSRHRTVEEISFDSYAETTKILASTLAIFPADIRLAPLRGAHRPVSLVEVMSNWSLSFRYFNFQANSEPINRLRIANVLSGIINELNPGNETFKIQIVDTAVGGYGIKNLVRILSEIRDKDYRLQSWAIDIHLLHSHTADVGNIESVKSQSSDRFHVGLSRHEVDDLIVEDYDDALGLNIENDEAKLLVKPSYTSGRFFLKKDSRTIFIVETKSLYLTFEKWLAESLTKSLLCDPGYIQTGQVVWNDYKQKA